MPAIIPKTKNLRVCEKCSATYAVDDSEYWVQYRTRDVPVDGECEFCRPTGKWSRKNN